MVRLLLLKALSKLEEARAIDPQAASGEVIHASYYAMLQAARASSMVRTGTYPYRHDPLHQNFGAWAAGDRELAAAHMDLRHAATARIASDYDVIYYPSAEEAVEIRSQADRLVRLVLDRLGISVSELGSI